MNAFKFFVGLSITFFLCKSRQGKINKLILIKWRAYLNSWVSDVLTSVKTRHCGVVWCGVVWCAGGILIDRIMGQDGGRACALQP